MTVLAWHFLRPDNKLRDGRDAPADGVALKQDDPIIPCENGLHASARAIDALYYYPGRNGSPVCRVGLRGTVVAHGDPVDKYAASERTILWRLDGETTDRVLHRFARGCALQVIHLWNAPDVVRKYLESGDEYLRSDAWDSAQDAAWSSVGGVARAAARAAARASAWDTTWSATRDAAQDAAWNAARATAWDSAWDASQDAARDAARAAQNTYFEQLINEAHERSVAE